MALYAINVTNRDNAEEVRAAHLPAHHDYLASNATIILIGGAVLDEDETKAIGAHYIIDCADHSAAQKFANDDPLTKAGARSKITVLPWRTAVFDREYVFGTDKAGASIPGQAAPLPRNR